MYKLTPVHIVASVFFAVFFFFPFFVNEYVFFIGQLTLIYVILAIGLNLLIGYSGQFAFANAALFGIGAYVTGLLVVRAGVPFAIAIGCGAIGAFIVGALIAIPALRLSGVYLGLATLSFAQFTSWVLNHWEQLTYGAGGFRVPTMDFSRLGVSSRTGLFYLIWLTTVCVFIFSWNLVHSRFGRAFAAIRDGELAAQSLGINLAWYKGLAFSISGLFAGLAGGFHAATLRFVAPESFDLVQMVLQFTMVLLGGLGSLIGSLLGAAGLMILIEATRGARGLQEIVFGSVILFLVLFQSGGMAALLNKFVPNWCEGLHVRERLRSASNNTPSDNPSLSKG